MRKFRVVLVEPEHPHNVGFVARAMHCYALPELYIVYPKRDKVLDKSYHTAANSHDILDNAKVVHKFEDAIGDCSCAVAYSRHTMVQNLSDMLPEDGTIALVFGRESCGLALEEVNACTYQCEIPVPGLMSLNLGQAVSISLYELCRSGALANGEGFSRLTASRSSSTAISRASITIRHGAIASLTRSCSACTRHVTNSQLCSVCSAIWLASPLA